MQAVRQFGVRVNPYRLARILAAACATILITSILSAPVSAHPHLRFGWQVEPLQDDAGAISALRIHWYLDPLSTMLVVRGIDIDRSGSVDAHELAAFAAQNDRLLAPSNYFVELARDGLGVPFVIRRGLQAQYDGARIILDFEVAVPDPAAGELSVRLFDRTWYVALSAADPVLIGGNAGRCAAVAGVESLATDGWGIQQVPVLRLNCRTAELAGS
jgi:ABC-type uncharacterized transport system substrate-binding protein